MIRRALILAAIAPLWLALASAAPLVLGQNHVPVAVKNFDAAQLRMQALGFTIKPGRFHANGIRNAHVKFANFTSIELITAPRATDPLTTTYRRLLAQGDGPAFLALHATDLTALAVVLGNRIERESEMISFRDGDPLALLFFGDIGPAPTDRPDYFRHPNSADSLDAVWLAPSDRIGFERTLGRLGVRFTDDWLCLPRCEAVRVGRMQQGVLILLPSQWQRMRGREIVGVTVHIASLDTARRAMRAGGVPDSVVRWLPQRRSVLVPPQRANGMWLELRAAR